MGTPGYQPMTDASPLAIPAVSVVVPVRNEAGNVAPLVEEIAAALADRRFEIVYVNDGSSDGTEAELRAQMRERPYLRQIRHDRSSGQSSAVRSGVARSESTRLNSSHVKISYAVFCLKKKKKKKKGFNCKKKKKKKNKY